MPQWMRTALGVMAGFLAINCVVIATTLVAMKVMHLKSGHPTPGYLVVNVAYSSLAALAGGAVAGLLARPRPMSAAYALAGIMLLFGIYSYVHYTGLQPLWYQLLMIVLIPLLAIAGAGIVARGRERRVV